MLTPPNPSPLLYATDNDNPSLQQRIRKKILPAQLTGNIPDVKVNQFHYRPGVAQRVPES